MPPAMYIENRRIVLSNLKMNTNNDSSEFKVLILQRTSSNPSYGVPTFIKIKATQPSSTCTCDFFYKFDVIDIQHLYSQISKSKMGVLSEFWPDSLPVVLCLSLIPSADGRRRYLCMSLRDV